MIQYFDENGIALKEGQIIKVYHFTYKRKKRYMYKQVAIFKDQLYALHLPIRDLEKKGGYWFRAVADENGKIDGTTVIQCLCKECIWGKTCI